MATADNAYTLDTVREALVRQEDTIVFGLIERAKFPFNSQTYDQKYLEIPGFCGSLIEFVVKDTEIVQAKAGRYENPEENAFFPENLLSSLVPSYPFTKILHPGAASININKSIWKIYFQDLLPLFVSSGDDGNYAQTAASDLSLLQAISKRVHYGKFVAEVKFRESPQDYEPLIHAKIKRTLKVTRPVLTITQMMSDKEGLMKLLTFKSVEEMVKKRVEKKATLFGQEISLNSSDDNNGKQKFDPSVASKLYEKWVIPLTKETLCNACGLRLGRLEKAAAKEDCGKNKTRVNSTGLSSASTGSPLRK
ncbi:chorismate mutase [Trifolium pratense]|uniref:Chorismate mutase n=1 Tax=Trifolium pratense TaxID=57577 RepID=A0A2K3PMH5_TRIPR|nr:chorismate mutase [Trifolium pratense]